MTNAKRKVNSEEVIVKSEWKKRKLGEVADIQTGPFGSQLHASDYVTDGIPSIMPTNIGNSLKINQDGISFITPADATRLNRYLVAEGDVVYSRRGDVEKCAFISGKEHGWLCGTGCLRIRFDMKIANSQYCAYYLSTKETKGWVSGNAVGTTMPNINSSILENLPLMLPPLPEQCAIAGVLSSLDDKIDLLRRQNKTLEAMAETLFRQWFIEEADEGWEEGTIADYAIHLKESVRPQDHPDSLFEHYSIPAFDAAEWPSSEYGETIQSNKYKVVKDCLLFSKLNPHRDKRIWMMHSVVGNNSICSTEFQVILPRKTEHLFFLYSWLSYKENYNELASGVGGTSGSHQRIDPHSIFSFRCPIVPANLINSFNKQVSPLFNKKRNNQLQIRTLTSFRDTLLPKLMSGEVRVNMGACNG